MMPLSLVIVLALLLDLAVGDPRFLPHPVGFYAFLAGRCEFLFRRIFRSERIGGAAAWIVVAGAAGAAAFVIMSSDRAAALGVKPMAVIRGGVSVGLDPAFMGMGPVPATRRVLETTGVKLDDIDLFEINEAFAVQVEAVTRELSLDPAKINVNGGAVALGHPIGASGARILATLLFEMKKRGSKLGVAALCIGGGEGVATILEAV